MRVYFIVLMLTFFCLKNTHGSSEEVYEFRACIKDAVTKDNKEVLHRWVFLSASSHPNLKSLINVSDEDILKVNKEVAKVVTKIFTQDCAEPLRKVVKKDPMIFQSTLDWIGFVVMNDLQMHQYVARSRMNYSRYLDFKKLEQAFDGK
jgi:hypothetical protein